MAAQKQDPEYTGPSGSEMINNQTLATEIMARNNDPSPVLDKQELARLRAFVDNPTTDKVAALNQEHHWDPVAREWNGSIIGYSVNQHGSEKPVFRQEDIVALQKWFESGAAGI